MESEKIIIPKWFWIISAILVVWNFIGVLSFFQHVMISEESLQALPHLERELYNQFPLWATMAFAIAVFGGFIGSILLTLKRKLAKTIFFISLVGIIIQMGHSLFIANSIEVYGSSAIILPIVITTIGGFSIWLCNYCITKRWII